MPKKLQEEVGLPAEIELKDEDIYAAMKAIPGYLDITPGTSKRFTGWPSGKALERLSRTVTAAEIMTGRSSCNPDTPWRKWPQPWAGAAFGVPVVDADGRGVGVSFRKGFLD